MTVSKACCWPSRMLSVRALGREASPKQLWIRASVKELNSNFRNMDI